MAKRRALLVGLGSRATMYRDATALKYPDTVELVGICDSNAGRLLMAQSWLKSHGLTVPGCPPEGFEKLIQDQRADLVIVVSRDCTHDDYIVRGLRCGCDIITEKPMTTTAEKCQRIVDTIKETGRNVRVTFNYRYSPFRTQVKELLQDGIIGRILSVEFKWMLDTSHGADYFRRWHRNKINSGGLMVHKATHHFDLVNWFINSVPVRVAAMGTRRFYTPEQAERFGLSKHGERCFGCPETHRCPLYLDLGSNSTLKSLYLDNEQYDGYYRDRCVFSPEIDIEDSMDVVVEYRSGVTMSYSLVAFSPWEGYHIVFNGTTGRLEHICQETSYISGVQTPGTLMPEATRITVMPHFAAHPYDVPIRSSKGGHGGGDSILLDDLFAAVPPPDPAGRRADYRSGAYSILAGIAANISMKDRRVVAIDELVGEIPLPDFTDDSMCDLPIELHPR